MNRSFTLFAPRCSAAAAAAAAAASCAAAAAGRGAAAGHLVDRIVVELRDVDAPWARGVVGVVEQ